ncbi:MAG TPA: NTP transferase domain-containing protein [Clostridia bacterium]|nr:NTP transferase domain-containing protein [Clostridia bacterium]
MDVNAVVLAGRKNDGALKEASAEEWEAEIDIGGRPMVSYVIRALRECEKVKEIAVVGPKSLREEAQSGGARLIEPAPGMLENLKNGVKALPHGHKTLIVTSDVPLITGEVVSRFLLACDAKDADFYYAVIPKNRVDEKYPGARRTWVKLRDGLFTGGNFLLITPGIVDSLSRQIDLLFRYRKNPAMLGRLLGFGFMLRFILGLIRIRDVEERVAKLCNIGTFAVVCDDPEIGVDVDKPEDLRLVRSILEKGVGQGE